MNRRGRTLALFLFAAAAALLIGGCGSGSETTTTEISKAQLIRRGDQICEETEHRQEESLQIYVVKHGQGTDLTDEGTAEKVVVAVGLPPMRRQVAELRALGAPEGDEAKVDAWLTATEEAIDVAEKNPSTMLALRTNPFNAVEETARGYGFTVCGGA